MKVIVIASAIVLAAEGNTQMAFTVFLQMLYTYGFNLEKLLARPEAAFDGLEDGQQIVVIREDTFKNAMTELVVGPIEEVTLGNLIDLCMQHKARSVSADESDESNSASYLWVGSLWRKIGKCSDVPFYRLERLLAKMRVYASSDSKVDEGKLFEDAPDMLKEYRKEVIARISGVVAITALLQNGQAIMNLLFSFGQLVNWLSGLSGTNEVSTNSTKI